MVSLQFAENDIRSDVVNQCQFCEVFGKSVIRDFRDNRVRSDYFMTGLCGSQVLGEFIIKKFAVLQA